MTFRAGTSKRKNMGKGMNEIESEEQEADKLNVFLLSHKVVAAKREFVQLGTNPLGEPRLGGDASPHLDGVVL